MYAEQPELGRDPDVDYIDLPASMTGPRVSLYSSNFRTSKLRIACAAACGITNPAVFVAVP